tara:strand:+ start:477 stop:755 length:279 start_codon:yes stop_codon:yes gene_type:complete
MIAIITFRKVLLRVIQFLQYLQEEQLSHTNRLVGNFMSGVEKDGSIHLHYHLQYREEEEGEDPFPASIYYSDAIDATFCTNLPLYRRQALSL